MLEPVYRMNSDFAKLVNVHEIQVKHAQDSRRRVELERAAWQPDQRDQAADKDKGLYQKQGYGPGLRLKKQ